MNNESLDSNKDILENILSASASENSKFRTSEDIYDDSGNKLLGKGYEITPKIKEKLFNRILKKPLEASIQSDNVVTTDHLRESAIEQLTANPILMHLKIDLKTEAKQLSYLKLDPLASLLLSVIRDTDSENFKHLLLCFQEQLVKK